MNLLHMKYAIEVAKAGSLNKAARILMIATPDIICRYNLIQKKCDENKKVYKDVLIYKFSEPDNLFITKLYEAVKKYL